MAPHYELQKKPNRKAQYAKGQNLTGSNAISKRKDVWMSSDLKSELILHFWMN